MLLRHEVSTASISELLPADDDDCTRWPAASPASATQRPITYLLVGLLATAPHRSKSSSTRSSKRGSRSNSIAAACSSAVISDCSSGGASTFAMRSRCNSASTVHNWPLHDGLSLPSPRARARPASRTPHADGTPPCPACRRDSRTRRAHCGRHFYIHPHLARLVHFSKPSTRYSRGPMVTATSPPLSSLAARRAQTAHGPRRWLLGRHGIYS